MKRLSIPTLFSLLLLLAACSSVSPAPEAPMATSYDPAAAATNNNEAIDAPLKSNIVAPGFLIAMQHNEDRDLNGKFRIDFNGKLDLPYNVSIQAGGLSIEELREKIAAAYKGFYKSNENLKVSVLEKAFFIELRGLIQKPGKYKIKPDTSIDEVIALGGGLQSLGNRDNGNANGYVNNSDSQAHYVKISQGNRIRLINLEDYYSSGSLNTLINWHGGEVIFFQKEVSPTELSYLELGNKIQVLGELRRPGEFSYHQGADVYYYLAEAGGPTRDADFTKIEIFRGAPGKRVVLQFELDHPEKIPAVQQGDILVFRSDLQTPTQKLLQAMANVATVVSAIALLIIAL